jgi:hypothetical protein
MKFVNIFFFSLVSMIVCGCSGLYEMGRYERNISHENRCQGLVGHTFILKEKNYLWRMSSKCLYATSFLPRRGKTIDGKYVMVDFDAEHVLECGTLIKVRDICTESHRLLPSSNNERIYSIYADVYVNEHTTVYADCTWFFQRPLSVLLPDPKFIEPVEFSH